MGEFPIDSLLSQLSGALTASATVLLQAPPGAGKTTRVPLALLGAIDGQASLPGRILMLEPRRLAAKAAASRLAASLKEPLGGRVGFAVRHEQRRSERTQLEVITDGLFLRRLQSDPSLKGVDCVIFDEFHERRRDSDLALTLLREARPLLHPELRLLLMSATLNIDELQDRLPEATLLQSEGRAFPVITQHQPPRLDEALPYQVMRAIEAHALPLAGTTAKAGNAVHFNSRPTVLVFLPGLREIKRTQELLAAQESLDHWELVCLHGQQPLDAQARVLLGAESPWLGKIVLASSIAESSLTLEGVRLVIDSGLSRQSRFDPNTGMEGLETVPSSQASACQRQGRAGRQGPGQCVRLWSQVEQLRRPKHSPPEVLVADPMPVVLELAAWGAGLGETLPWLDPPPLAALQKGMQQLINLNALDRDGRITSSGRHLCKLGVHPRLGILLLQSQAWGCEALGADLAALLSDRDPLSNHEFGSDLRARLEWLRGDGRETHCPARKRHEQMRRLSKKLLLQLKAIPLHDDYRKQAEQGSSEYDMAAQLIAIAFPEWLALERPGQAGSYRLRQGRGALLHRHDPLRSTPVLAVARVDLGQANTLIQLALPLSMQWLEKLSETDGEWCNSLSWDEESSRIRAERHLKVGELLIQRERLFEPEPERCLEILLGVLCNKGLEQLPWGRRSHQLRQRLELAHHHLGRPWPLRDLEHLANQPNSWLNQPLLGCLGFDELGEEGLIEALWGDLSWEMRQNLDLLLPKRLTIPSGRSAELSYGAGEVRLSVKLQEMFGCEDGPTLLDGKLPVTLELLSPAGRTLQLTSDLSGFWSGSYQEVRREMRGRYPKHPWPENPREAKATASIKKHMRD
ncbi:MAG: ATP-dependent helicase HrpB [Prochlorococcus sp.]